MRIFGKLEYRYFLTNTTIQFAIKSVHISKSYSKNQRGPDLTEHGVHAISVFALF